MYQSGLVLNNPISCCVFFWQQKKQTNERKVKPKKKLANLEFFAKRFKSQTPRSGCCNCSGILYFVFEGAQFFEGFRIMQSSEHICCISTYSFVQIKCKRDSLTVDYFEQYDKNVKIGGKEFRVEVWQA